MKSFIVPIESASYYILYTLFNVSTNAYNASIYQHLICLIFIFLVIFIAIILYNDTIYKEADNIKRCRYIDIITKINENRDNPYRYKIYIVKKEDVKKVSTNYIFYIDYDFDRKTSSVTFGNNHLVINEIGIPIDNGDSDTMVRKAFQYYDLETQSPLRIEYTYAGNKYYINKDLISGEDYEFIIEGFDKKSISDDPSAIELLKFVRSFGYNSEEEYTNMTPINNIEYAIVNKQNSLSK
jgi:hypothetical protein